MYLSVTPHIQPTHTQYSDDEERLPPQFRPSSDYDTETDSTTPIDALIDHHVDTARSVADMAQNSAQIQEQMAAALKQALAAGDEKAAAEIRDVMWEPLLETFKKVNKMAAEWNTLTPRAGSLRTYR
jgi:hypothetical protein